MKKKLTEADLAYLAFKKDCENAFSKDVLRHASLKPVKDDKPILKKSK